MTNQDDRFHDPVHFARTILATTPAPEQRAVPPGGTFAEAGIDMLIRNTLFPGASAYVMNVRFYSSDMSAAWDVVEAMRERGWEFQFEWDHPETLCPVATFWRVTDQGLQTFTAESYAPAMTICQAALGALHPEHRERH